MAFILIDPQICPQDHSCPLVKICPVEAISQEGFALPKIDHDECILCGACVRSCPKQAVRKEE